MGEDRTGKTQVNFLSKVTILKLCLTTVAENLLCKEKNDSYIVYLDFNGSFKPERLVQIMEAREKFQVYSRNNRQVFRKST